jgi:MFS family permease
MLNRLRTTTADYPRQFWLLFWGMLLNSTGASLIWPFLTIYIRQRLGIPLTTVALLLTLQSAFWLLATSVAGPAMDQLGRKTAMLVSLIGNAATLIAMSVADTFPLWVLLAAAYGAFNPLYRIGADAMIADTIEPDRRVDAYALMRTSINMGISIGPAIGGFITSVSYALAFHLAAGAHLAFTLLIVFLVAETMPPQRGSTEQPRSEMSYAPVLRDRPFMAFCGMLVVVMMPGSLMFLLLPVYLKENFGLPESQYGFIMATNAAMVVAFQYGITRIAKRHRPLLALTVGALFYALGAGSVAWGWTFPAFLASMIVLTVGEMLIFPTSTALTANLAPPDMRARYMGFYSLTWAIGRGIGPVIGGLLNDHIAPVAIWYGALVMGIVGALGFLWLDRSPRRRDAWTQSGLRPPDQGLAT